uniref:Uncharacterized protein n=2 Tax=Emiliania huxleyi TaxID=2903 RepID=A0A6V2SV52_EMIHU
MSDTIGFTTRDGVERISNIWPWPWSPTRRPAAEDRHALSLLDTSVLPPPPPPPPRAACLPCNCSNTSVIERMAARLEQQERTIAELKAQLSSVSRPAQLRERATERQGREGGPIPPADTASSEGAVGAEARSSS